MKLIKTLALTLAVTLTSMTPSVADAREVRFLDGDSHTIYIDDTQDRLRSNKSYSVGVFSHNRFFVEEAASIVFQNMALNGGKAFKTLHITNPEFNRIVGECYSPTMIHPRCSMMFQFDRKEPKRYQLGSNIDNDTYSIQLEQVESFYKEASKAKEVRTKINDTLFIFNLEHLDLNRIDFK